MMIRGNFTQFSLPYILDVGSSTSESRGDQKKQDSPNMKALQRKKSGTNEIKRRKQIEARRQRRQKWKVPNTI